MFIDCSNAWKDQQLSTLGWPFLTLQGPKHAAMEIWSAEIMVRWSLEERWLRRAKGLCDEAEDSCGMSTWSSLPKCTAKHRPIALCRASLNILNHCHTLSSMFNHYYTIRPYWNRVSSNPSCRFFIWTLEMLGSDHTGIPARTQHSEKMLHRIAFAANSDISMQNNTGTGTYELHKQYGTPLRATNRTEPTGPRFLQNWWFSGESCSDTVSTMWVN